MDSSISKKIFKKGIYHSNYNCLRFGNNNNHIGINNW
jgi:hypothetical protein